MDSSPFPVQARTNMRMTFLRLLLLIVSWLALSISVVASALAVASLWQTSRIALGFVFIWWDDGLTQVAIGTVEEAYWGYWYRIFDNGARSARVWQVPWVDLSESYAEVRLFIPWWFTVLTTLALAVVLIHVHRGGASRHREACSNCGYNLHLNTSGVCPECGCFTNRFGGER